MTELLILIQVFTILLQTCDCIDYIQKSSLLSDVETHYQLSSFTNIKADSRHLDLVLVGPNHDEIFVRSYDASNETYNHLPGYHYSFQLDSQVQGYDIMGILPADFNDDKTTDLMVTFAYNDEQIVKYKVAILWNRNKKFYSVTHLNSTFSDVPHLIDFDGDLFIDFICAEEETRYFYINDNSNPGSFDRRKIFDSNIQIDFSAGENSYAYGDLNGDCEADLFMITKLKNGSSIFEFYEAQEKELKMGWQMNVPLLAKSDKYGAPLIVDMDGNGKMDIVVAGCSDVSQSSNVCLESKIIIFYNDPCYSSDNCAKNQNNCKKHPFNKFNIKDHYIFRNFVSEKSKFGFLNFNKASDIFGSNYLIRASDYNSDGKVDLFSVLKFDNTQQAVIFKNIEDPTVIGGRSFEIQWRDDIVIRSDLNETYQPFALAPVDALGIGSVQFFLVGRNKNDLSDFSLNFFESKEPLDAYFLKVTVLCQKCDAHSTTMIGANAFYYTKDYKGRDQVGYGCQNSQLAPFSLQPPYMLFGLGPQANYIQYLEVSYRNTLRVGETVDSFHFDQLIPNTQVFAIPTGDVWKLVMMVVPGKTLWTTLLVLGILSVIAMVIILGLHIKEKKEDEREKRKFNAKFNFDAM